MELCVVTVKVYKGVFEGSVNNVRVCKMNKKEPSIETIRDTKQRILKYLEVLEQGCTERDQLAIKRRSDRGHNSKLRFKHLNENGVDNTCLLYTSDAADERSS